MCREKSSPMKNRQDEPKAGTKANVENKLGSLIMYVDSTKSIVVKEIMAKINWSLIDWTKLRACIKYPNIKPSIYITK